MDRARTGRRVARRSYREDRACVDRTRAPPPEPFSVAAAAGSAGSVGRGVRPVLDRGGV